jgi:hypothetical protein
MPHNTSYKLKGLKLAGDDHKGFKAHFDGDHDRYPHSPPYSKPISVAFSKNAEGMVQLKVTQKTGLLTETNTVIIWDDSIDYMQITQSEQFLWMKQPPINRTFMLKHEQHQEEMADFLANNAGLGGARLANLQNDFVYVEDGRGVGLEGDFMRKTLQLLAVCQNQKPQTA